MFLQKNSLASILNQKVRYVYPKKRNVKPKYLE